ncbi:MAG TPA: alpha/beta fold hydrolase [Usitatibacter sp.]|jgi:pimeloyl-ACP methyl ester carboxylesterase/predicted glycosyltransferase|nr:alpha/beta fold hydrolase [Usitatibacter sp.]
MTNSFPDSFASIVGELAEPGRVPEEYATPFETVRPAVEGFVEREGVKSWYAVWGASGPWLAFAPIFQIAHSQLLKAAVPWLSQQFRVVTMDARGNGRSDRPQGQPSYTFDHYYRDFVAVLDAVGADRVAVVGISATAMTAIRLAAEEPARVSHLIAAGGYAHMRVDNDKAAGRVRAESDQMREDWPAHLEAFFSTVFNEPHSTKPFEDGVRYGWATSGEVVDWCRKGWIGNDVTELAKKVTCPTLVIHGDADKRTPYAAGRAIHELVRGSRLLTIEGGGHLTAVRDPVVFNHALRDFVLGRPRTSKWTRAMSRKRKALFVSSPIGLGHVQRDLAIARELRKLHPDLGIDWFTVDPAAAYLQREGEHVHPITSRLANESRHFEHCAGEHDLHAFFALRTMDEIMVNNFMTFSDLVENEHYDIVIGDEAWDVDYYYHENPELKRQPFVFLTDFVGCLPMGGDEREAFLCADRNADDIEHVARFPYVRDAAIFVGNAADVTQDPFGPGMPSIREWTDANFSYAGYTLPFDPAAFADTEKLRARLGYSKDEKVAIAAVGGTGVGQHLLGKIAKAFPRMKRETPELRLVLVAGPRLSPDTFPKMDGLEVRPYVHNLFEHLACCDLALVQGGLSTCMELVATRRPFLSFPLQHHFEQCLHVRKRLANYGADRSVDYAGLTPEALADAALAAMHAPVRYKAVEADGAARAARRIAEVLENR